MESLLLILFFSIFPLTTLLLIIVLIKNYLALTNPKNREENIVRATDRMRVQMLDSAIHELGNIATSLLPLFENIKLSMQQSMQQQDSSNSDVNQDIITITEQLNRIIETKYDASVFSQLISNKTEFVNVNECIRGCWRVLRHDKRTTNTSVELSLSNSLGILNISSASLMSVIINLFSNALDALAETKNKRSISIETFQTKDNVVIIMSDSGIGMSDEIKGRIKTAYFTTKEKGKGTGLGLSIIQDVMKSSAGRIEIDSKEGVGTTVSLHFPITE